MAWWARPAPAPWHGMVGQPSTSTLACHGGSTQHQHPGMAWWVNPAPAPWHGMGQTSTSTLVWHGESDQHQHPGMAWWVRPAPAPWHGMVGRVGPTEKRPHRPHKSIFEYVRFLSALFGHAVGCRELQLRWRRLMCRGQASSKAMPVWDVAGIWPLDLSWVCTQLRVYKKIKNKRPLTPNYEYDYKKSMWIINMRYAMVYRNIFITALWKYRYDHIPALLYSRYGVNITHWWYGVNITHYSGPVAFSISS